MSNKIMLVDDEVNVLSALKRALLDSDLDIVSVTSAEHALEMMKHQTFKVVVSDERMIGMQGSDFLGKVREKYPHTVRMILTGHASLEAAIKAVNLGEIYRFFSKPWNDNELKYAIKSAIEKYDLEAENRRLLATIKQQSFEIKVLEKRFPGISRVKKDSHGVFVLPDISDDEIKNMLAECEQEIA